MSIERRGRQQKIDDARDALRLVQQVIEHPQSSDPTLKRVTALMAQHLGCDEYQAASLLENAGIQEPLRIHLTDQRVKRFVRACRTDLQLTPLPEGFHQDKPRPATSTQRAAAAAVLASFLQQLDADPQARLSLPYLTAQLSNALTYRYRHTAILLERASIVDPLNLSLRSWSTGRFLQTVISSPAHYPPPVPIADLDQYRNPDMESPDAYGRKRKKAAKAPATTAALASSFPQRETPKQQVERLERERKERAQQHLQRATPRARPKTAPPANPVANKTAARLAQTRGLLKAASRQHVSPATMTRRREVLVRDLANTLALPPSVVQELMTSAGLTLSSSGLAEDRITVFLDAVRAHPVSAQPAATKTAPVTAALPVTVPATRATAALAACRRLVAGNATGEAAKLTADLYLAIVELSAYGVAPEHRAAAHIAAERFGVHTDAVTAAQLHARAKRAYDRGGGGEVLDHLSRLARRPRGVFYDGHLDRLTLWETEGLTMTLYTCSVPELRACAAGALERGDLILPWLAKKTLDARTEPTRAQDPALILAVAAEQLGKQSELARRRAQTHPATDARPDQVLILTTGRRPAERDQITRPGVTWVVPVAGTHKNLDIGRMDTSYTHHTAGPRSRRATTVREHKRRPAGSSPYAQPTVTVRAHPRRGT